MYSVLLAFAHWLQNTPPALWLASSTWAYPPVQALHFFGLSLWIGTNIAVDLRLLGLGRRSYSIYDLSRALRFWNWTGFAIAVTGGFSLFSVSAAGYVANPAFETKLGILIPLGLVLHVVNQQKSRDWSQSVPEPVVAKCAGLAELSVWMGVVIAAVAIPYF